MSKYLFKMNIYGLSVVIFILFNFSDAWGDSGKVKLTDVSTLTLYSGKMTTGRRASPIPQVHCVGGTAGCTAFKPQVVQCYNRGSDGFDVQWECKTDMDNAYRFGKINVMCEGYDYPDDHYILKGSCGLEYTLDLTEEGFKKKGGHNYYGGWNTNNYGTSYPTKKGTSLFGDILTFAVVLLVIYIIYKTCISNRQYSRTSDGFDDDTFRSGSFPGGGRPPPPGFMPGYDSGGGCGPSTAYGTGTTYGTRGTGMPGNNFWTGAAAGGILGYMFGNRRDGQTYYQEPRRSSGWGGFGDSSSSSSSSGTRTASGFGGTSRR